MIIASVPIDQISNVLWVLIVQHLHPHTALPVLLLVWTWVVPISFVMITLFENLNIKFLVHTRLDCFQNVRILILIVELLLYIKWDLELWGFKENFVWACLCSRVRGVFFAAQKRGQDINDKEYEDKEQHIGIATICLIVSPLPTHVERKTKWLHLYCW